MIYTIHDNREITLKEARDGQFKEDLARHLPDCVDGVYMLVQELSQQDPDLDEWVGRLADNYDVAALAVPGSRACSLMISVTYGDDHESIVYVHGIFLAPVTAGIARSIVAKCHGLTNPSWELIENE